MLRAAKVCAPLALALGLVGCGPGRLPSNLFGTAGDDAGETAAEAEAEADGGPGSTTTTPSEAPSDSGEGSDSVGDDQTDDGDPSGGDGDGDGDDSSTGGSTTATTSGDGDGDSGGDGDGGGDGDDGGDGDGDSGDDGWGTPPDVTNEPCEPLAQDCYPTHKCVPFATQLNSSFFDADKCMPILGDKKWGEPCTLSSHHEAQDDCDGDGFCWNLQWNQGQLEGTCVPFCLGTPQNLICPLGWGSLFSGALALCPKRCDPLLQDCSNYYGCYWGGNNFQCLLTAAGAGPNHTCNTVGECLPGLACIDKAAIPGCIGNDPRCCTPWCSLGAPDCAGGLECVPFFDLDQVPDLLADVGVCIAP